MSRVVFIRALWGDESVATYEKALWDIEVRADRLPEEAELRLVAYGESNAVALRQRGYAPTIILPDELPGEYRTLPPADRPREFRKERPGEYTDGISTWWHKLHAIRAGMHHAPCEGAIWLDFDTRILRAPDDALYRMLAEGPPFQSCRTVWRSPRSPWREGLSARAAYHGGCYYFRDVGFVERVIQAHAALWCSHSDETAVTYLADRELADVPGVENTRFYRTRKMLVGVDGANPYFHEGEVFKLQEFRDRYELSRRAAKGVR